MIHSRAEIIGFTYDGQAIDIPVGQYPNGEPIVKLHGDHSTQPTFEKLLVRTTSLQSFYAALYFIDAMKERGHMEPTLVIPCLPGQRQDRLNDSGDYLFTAKSIARDINARRFPQVVVFDPHSDVMPGLIDRCKVVHAQDAFEHPSAIYDAVIAPDGGAEKRAYKVAQHFKIPVLHAGKTRDIVNGKITDFWLHNGHNAHFLVVDDLCDGGGTFVGLAEEIANVGATADLYVSHGLFTRGTEVVTLAYRNVYTTDSTVGEKPGVQILPVCHLLLETNA